MRLYIRLISPNHFAMRTMKREPFVSATLAPIGRPPHHGWRRWAAPAGLLALFLWCLPAAAQITLRGQVLDAETQQPIPNAQVGVADNRIGTSTNDDGRFALNIPPQYQQATLEVSLMGYRK